MRVLKFGSVGVLNTLVDYAVFNALVLGAGMSVVPANLISYSTGIANSWFWNKRWTFADRPMRYPRLALPMFVVVNLVGLALNTGAVIGLQALGTHLGVGEMMPEAVYLNIYKTLAIAVSYTWNYLAIKHLVFR